MTLVGIGYVPLWSVYSKQLPLMMGPGGARTADLPPAPREKNAAPALPASAVYHSAPSRNDRPEGEFVALDPPANGQPIRNGNQEPPARTSSDPVRAVNQSRSANAAEPLPLTGSQLALGGLVSTVMTSDWPDDVSGDRRASALDLVYGRRSSEASLDVNLANLPMGDAAPPGLRTLGAGSELSDHSWWLDEVLSDVLLPLFGESSELLSDADEGGPVETGVWAETLVSSDVRRTEKTAGRDAQSPDEDTQCAPDRTWREAVEHQPEQMQVVDPNRAVVESERGDDRRALTSRASAATSVEDEGGMTESLTGGPESPWSADEVASAPSASAPSASAPSASAPSASAPSASPLETIEVRMDATVGLYQAFDLSTNALASDAQTRMTVVEPREER